MREIKFRAWNPVQKLTYPAGSAYSCKEGVLGEFETDNEDGEVLMQYTGLKDKNGKEIYEGDVIDFAGLKPLKIVWRESGFEAPLLPYENSNPIVLTQEGFGHFAEVMGNIYENPELLTGI